MSRGCRGATRRGGALTLAAVALAGCGSAPADLFVVHRTGSVPGARLELLISDGGTGRCNGRSPRPLSGPELLRARQLQRDLHPAASTGLVLPAGPGAVFTYAVQTPAGRLRFSDTSPGISPVLRGLAALTHEVAQRVCGLAR